MCEITTIIKFPIELRKYRNRTAKISADITILLFKAISEFLPPVQNITNMIIVGNLNF